MRRLVRSRRPPGLRALLTALAFGVLGFPLALALLTLSLVSGGLNERPMIRFSSVSAELRKAVARDGPGGLKARPGYAAPSWLELVVADNSGRVVWSNMAGLAAGGLLGPRDLERLQSDRYGPPSSADGASSRAPICFYAERVEIGETVLGSWYALVQPVDLRNTESRGSIYYRLLFLVMLSLVAVLSAAGVSALVARAVMRLERAAGAIAAGDLDTAVSVRGVREIQALAEAMDRMRESLREDRDQRARFLAAVSHDLRTPLTSIGGYLEAVEDGLAEEPGTLARYVSIMQAKTRVLEGRIQGLLEFARMETGEWRQGFERLALGPFLDGLAAEFAEDASLAGKRLDFRLDAAAGLEVLADPVLMRRAFENVLANALRYGPPGSSVGFHARRGSLGELGVGLIVEIDDEGPGIPDADRERIFEAFYRGSKAREGEGAGLGLYIARSVLTGHGWSLEAQASPSGGARFVIHVPKQAWLQGA